MFRTINAYRKRKTVNMPKARLRSQGRLEFYCPGCKCKHDVNVMPGTPRPLWTWNDSYTAPTLAPSVHVKTGHYVTGAEPSVCEYCIRDRDEDPKYNFKSCTVCHSFVREGKIEFLTDCTHELAGQTVDLPELETSEW